MSNIRKFLDVSTSHLAPYTRDALNAGHSPGMSVYPHPDGYGWFMYVPEERGNHDKQNHNFHDLWLVLTYARHLGCDYVMFDCDADIDANLPVYPDHAQEAAE